MQTSRHVFLWVLYDFANSLVSIVFFLYFAQWIVIEQGFSDFAFNITFTIAAFLLLFTVPVSGYLLDKCVRRIIGLRYTTMFTVLFYGLCSLSAISNKNVLALVFFTLGLYSYLLSFTFYTPLLQDIANLKHRGVVSGLGIAANYVGQFVGLLIALPFSTKSLSIFGASGRAETLLPSVGLFFLFSLPMLLLFKEPRMIPTRIISPLKEILWETKQLFSYSSVTFFLAAYFLFNDAILTVSNNFPLFLEQVWHVSDTTKTYLLLASLTMCAIGGPVSGVLADKFGHKKTLLVILSGWVILLPVLALITNFTWLVIATTIMGLWFGAVWTVSRSVMAYLAPQGKHNLAFAYFGLAERASSFVGPLAWGGVIAGLSYLGSDKYRIAVLAITGFMIIGVFMLAKVKSDRSVTA